MAPYPHTDRICKQNHSEEVLHTITFNWQGRPYSQEMRGHGPHDPIAPVKATALPVSHCGPQAAMLCASLRQVWQRVAEYLRCE